MISQAVVGPAFVATFKSRSFCMRVLIVGTAAISAIVLPSLGICGILLVPVHDG